MTTAEPTHEFASPGWLEAVRGIFERAAADAAPGELDGVDFTFCEVYTGVPAHLSADGTLAWHVRVQGSEVTFAVAEAEVADVKITSDYATVLPFATKPFDGASPPPEVVSFMVKAMGEGKFSMVASGTPPPPPFASLHNSIAAITTRSADDEIVAGPPFDPTEVLIAEELDLSPFVDEMQVFNSAFAEMAGNLTTPDQPGGIAKMREAMAGGGLFGGPATAPPETRTVDGPGGPIPIRVFVADEVNAVYLDIHGGGWAFGSAEMGDAENWRIAQTCGVAVVSVDYRLAPEHHHPAGLDDCEAVALWLLKEGAAALGSESLILGGASAGAHLAALTLLRLRDSGADVSRIKGANLVVGVYDITGTPSQRGSTSPLSGTWSAAQALTSFYCPHLSEAERRDPSVSPLYADLSGLPPALFTAAGLDALRDDSLFMAARWEAAGSPADLVVFPGAVHIFTGLPTRMSAIAVARMHAFICDRALA